jgi:hypothetical protein
MDGIFNGDALSLGVEQRLERQPSPTLTQGHHDPMRAGDRTKSPVQGAYERNAIFEHASGLARLHQIEDPVPSPLPHFLGHGIGQVALTEYKNIFDERP